MRIIAFALSLLLCPTAFAQDPACTGTPDGKSVTCDAGGFGLMVKACVENETNLKECSIKLTATQEQLAATKTALDKCISTIPPVPLTPTKPPMTKPVIGYIMGIAGAAAMATGAAMDSGTFSTGTRLGVSGVGLTLAVTGLFFVLPWD